ncbi:hypothetical protein N7478_007103 [Penicillium angulare]|uniref:uncharacterized protein n=1 Tax=Penicillium angulare TaxID=116970 RepID=UPI002540C446|nr:uncharacterized protein N7478_007103 [Penicillium angulare]KAJ5281731.1 hypothetical protein N7478_007103 [Penicillium angulare]
MGTQIVGDVTACKGREEGAARTIQKPKVDDYDENLENEENQPPDDSANRNESAAHKNWQRAVSVAIRAGRDDNRMINSASHSEHAPTKSPETIPGGTPNIMDLQYFLEMVDVKHRHGSNLRAYHNVWKNSPSNQNFFYWLDYGDGKEVDLPERPREKLEKEQVRYLSPAERLKYMVTIDDEGLFRWVKNNELVETDRNKFKDSIHGVVHMEDKAPKFEGNSTTGNSTPEFESNPSSSSESTPKHTISTRSSEEGQLFTEQDYELGKAVKKFSRIKPEAIYDHFASTVSVKDGMWIFVADSSFRIYIGIKEPGAFQHSSFLRGGRIAAAGMLKIRHGKLRSLAPLSGHYRPHLANFRAFHHSLQDRGVDLSRVSISKSYAILAGIEGYTLTKRKLTEKIEGAKQKIHPTRHPEETAQK